MTNLNVIKEKFNRFKLLKFVDWKLDYKYSTRGDSDDICLSKNETECEKDSKCVLRKRKSNQKNECISTKFLKTFKPEETIIEQIYDCKKNKITEESYTILYIGELKVQSEYLENVILQLRILKDLNNYFVLFGYGIDFEYTFNTDDEYGEIDIEKAFLNSIIDIIRFHCKDRNKNLHLYGHSMGSIIIKYLIHLNEFRERLFIFNKIVIRISAVTFNKLKIGYVKEWPTELTHKWINNDQITPEEKIKLDYYSLNLFNTKTNLIDRYSKTLLDGDRDKEVKGIDDFLKDKTLFLLVDDTYKPSAVENLNEIEKYSDFITYHKSEYIHLLKNIITAIDNIEEKKGGGNIKKYKKSKNRKSTNKKSKNKKSTNKKSNNKKSKNRKSTNKKSKNI